MPLITLRGARMVKSMFGLLIENNTLLSFTRCCLNANGGKASDSLLFQDLLSGFSYRFSQKISSTQPQPCCLTDRLFVGENDVNITGFYSGRFIVWVSGLSLLTMPPREQKTTQRVSVNSFRFFSSSRYSLAPLGLKGDQNLIC